MRRWTLASPVLKGTFSSACKGWPREAEQSPACPPAELGPQAAVQVDAVGAAS